MCGRAFLLIKERDRYSILLRFQCKVGAQEVQSHIVQIPEQLAIICECGCARLSLSAGK
jgi:hypothetical protein